MLDALPIRILVSRRPLFAAFPHRSKEATVVRFDRDWASSLDQMQREMERYLHHFAQKKPHVVFSRRAWEPAPRRPRRG